MLRAPSSKLVPVGLSRAGLAIVAMAVGLCSAAPPASAEPAWVAPQTAVELAAGYGGLPTAFGAEGEALMVWPARTEGVFTLQAISRPPGGEWEAPTNVTEAPLGYFEPRVAISPHGEALIVSAHYSGETQVVDAFSRPHAGEWRPAVALSEPGKRVMDPQVAFNAEGEAVAAWSLYNGTYWMIQEASKPPGAEWRPPVTISEPGVSAYAPVIAVGPGDEAVVAWMRENGSFGSYNYSVQAAARPAGGAWQAPVTVSQPLAYGGWPPVAPSIGADARGDALLVWEHGGSNSPAQAAWKPAGGVWQTPENISEPGASASGPEVAVDPAGHALVVWWRLTPYHPNGAIAVSGTVGGEWQAPVTISAPGEEFTLDPRVAVDPGGEAIVVWQRTEPDNSQVVRAAIRFDRRPMASTDNHLRNGWDRCRPAGCVRCKRGRTRELDSGTWLSDSLPIRDPGGSPGLFRSSDAQRPLHPLLGDCPRARLLLRVAT